MNGPTVLPAPRGDIRAVARRGSPRGQRKLVAGVRTSG